MTRRIAITILLTVCSAILIAGVGAWLTVREILLLDLDASIVRRATTLAAGTGASAGPDISFGEDRFVIKGPMGQTLDRQPVLTARAAPLHKVDAAFVRLPEGRFRRISFTVTRAGEPGVVSLIYSAPATEFDLVLRRLALTLTACGIVAGGIASFLAARLARIALRPLSRTAQVITEIDESHLDRRIDTASLPPELVPMATRLNEMVERLQVAFEQRRRFLADASHELRTPVAALVTIMEVALRRPRTSAEMTETVETCLGEARHLRELVQALMRQVRGEGTDSPGESINFDAGETVRQCTDLTQPLAAERQIRIVPDVHGIIPMRAEQRRLRSIVLNLVSNAIEYNHPGGTVEVRASRQNELAEIVVKDDGPGISPEHLPHLFQPFYRADPARNIDGHLGLGLFLVDSHVKAMGGQCRVESALGRGTTFRVSLPSVTHITEVRSVENSNGSSHFHLKKEMNRYAV